MKIKVKATPYTMISNALNYAISSGMDKCDKYCNIALSEEQRQLLTIHIDNYFWLNIEEYGIEFE